jgi:hypothetical protein
MGMSILGLVGVSGLYLRQVKETGLLGLVGYLMFGSFFVLTTAFTFAETLIVPPLAAEAPQFVDSFLGIFSGSGVEIDLVTLEAIAPAAAVLYLLGGSLFGIAIFRAGILEPRAAILLVSGRCRRSWSPCSPRSGAVCRRPRRVGSGLARRLPVVGPAPDSHRILAGQQQLTAPTGRSRVTWRRTPVVDKRLSPGGRESCPRERQCAGTSSQADLAPVRRTVSAGFRSGFRAA